MPVGQMQVWDASTDPNKLLGRRGQYTTKANFLDKRLGGSQGYLRGLVYLRLPRGLTPEQAKKYEQALRRL